MYTSETMRNFSRTGLQTGRLGKSELRTLVFKINQLAQDSLNMENTNLQLAAGTMALLDAHVRRYPSLPDAFTELADKDYAATTVRLIQTNSARMKARLSVADQAALEKSVSIAARLPDYAYYVDNYEKVKRYRQLLPEYQRRTAATDNQNKTLAVGGLALGGGLLLFGPIVCLGVVGLGGYLLFEHGVVGALIIGLAFLGFVALVVLFRQQHAKARDIESQVCGITAQVDVARFAELEREFGADLARVTQLRQIAETELNAIS